MTFSNFLINFKGVARATPFVYIFFIILALEGEAVTIFSKVS